MQSFVLFAFLPAHTSETEEQETRHWKRWYGNVILLTREKLIQLILTYVWLEFIFYKNNFEWKMYLKRTKGEGDLLEIVDNCQFWTYVLFEWPHLWNHLHNPFNHHITGTVFQRYSYDWEMEIRTLRIWKGMLLSSVHKASGSWNWWTWSRKKNVFRGTYVT